MSTAKASDNPFADTNYQPFAKDYLKELLTNIRDLDQRTRRSTLLTVTFATLFFIAHKNPRSSVTIFTLRIDDLSPLLAIIPVVTAYLFTSIVSTSVDTAVTGKTAYRVLLAAYPQLVKERWFYPLMPGDSPFTGPQSLHEEHVLSYARMALVLVGPPVLSAIELYLYGDRVGWSAASFIVSAAVCLVMVTVGIWTLKVATASIDKSR